MVEGGCEWQKFSLAEISTRNKVGNRVGMEANALVPTLSIIHVLSILLQMTKLLLPKMLEKKKGLIVNISSSSSYGPTTAQVT